MSETDIKILVKQLGESINETLADSPKINERIKEIKASGYEVFLIIEAKIEFSRKAEKGDETAHTDAPTRLQITQEDAKFLKTLRISSDDI
jgi:hypothetical protein